ncbi:hypothetical protein B0H17DRAFT_1092321 [Mycena rosella]|uniref:Uncharacterized protein n=1 Tax=Mycena rosella TaxID=1033263 RepID=A0AAD7CV05_MYCRO|nr:hypothetical protein B0H17DRAFT_1092321 [Mycena rosella]
MSTATTHQFLLTLGTGNGVPQLVYINVIVSLEGPIRLDVSSNHSSIPPPQPHTIVDLTSTLGHVSAGAPDGNRNVLSITATGSTAGPSANPVVGIAPPAPPPSALAHTRRTAVSATSTLPPAYFPGTPPPAYTPPSLPLIASSNPAALSAPAVPVTIQPPAPPLIQLPLARTRIRARALPERRRFVPPPPPPPSPLVVEGPGFLNALLEIGLELLPLKRRSDTPIEGRYAKRRRL